MLGAMANLDCSSILNLSVNGAGLNFILTSLPTKTHLKSHQFHAQGLQLLCCMSTYLVIRLQRLSNTEDESDSGGREGEVNGWDLRLYLRAAIEVA